MALTAPPPHNGTDAPIGLAGMAKLAFDSADLAPLHGQLVARAMADPQDAAAFLDLSILMQLAGDRTQGLALQVEALAIQRLFRRPAAGAATPAIRLLAFMTPGDLMANTPLEFLLDGSDLALDLLYVIPGVPLPAIPEHDLAFVAVGESDENRSVLREIARFIPIWPRPVLNAPDRIMQLSREGTGMLLQSEPSIVVPATGRIHRVALEELHRGLLPIQVLLADGAFPILVRPIGSHAGHGLAKLDDAAAVGEYLGQHPEDAFFVTRFVDYRGADGFYRKYRIALIEGRPFACHLAISSHWMVHYLNADMHESAEKRAEEARFMAEFDNEFARRQATALQALGRRVGLDYFAIDCGETPDGRLLLFEADVAMIVHAMDPPDLFPYKQRQMQKVFGAFRAMLGRACRRAPALDPVVESQE